MRSNELAEAMARVCADPHRVTVPYGIDDGIMRSLVLTHTMATLMIHQQGRTVRIVQITSLSAR
ncbi:hypothetical protein ACFVIM_31350 [Streptomyces sp. NPDC057638]|uniref:hypothetical protein n=1 Tax=Streptomyces sp. NPDC057638 TaxID=3346190 RepID=UPI0036B98B5B